MANERARQLRKDQTSAEAIFWKAVRGKRLDGYKFRRQHPLGKYIVDFVCLEVRLIIELDGDHHGKDAQIEHDQVRDSWLERQGFEVMRVWNNDVYKNLEGVLLSVSEKLRTLRVDLPPP